MSGDLRPHWGGGVWEVQWDGGAPGLLQVIFVRIGMICWDNGDITQRTISLFIRLSNRFLPQEEFQEISESKHLTNNPSGKNVVWLFTTEPRRIAEKTLGISESKNLTNNPAAQARMWFDCLQPSHPRFPDSHLVSPSFSSFFVFLFFSSNLLSHKSLP